MSINEIDEHKKEDNSRCEPWRASVDVAVAETAGALTEVRWAG